MIYLIVIASILFLVLSLKRLDWAVLLIIAALPTYLIRFQIFGLPLTFLEVMILIAFTVWFIKFFAPGYTQLMHDKKARLNYPFSIEIILLLVISLVAVGTAGWSNSALGIWKAYFFEPLLLFILIFNVFRTKKDWSRILAALAISAAVISLTAIFQQLTGLFIANPFWAAKETRRAVSFFGYPNAIGLYLAPLVMIFTGWFASLDWRGKLLTVDKHRKLLLIVLILISIGAIICARSEGALVGLLAGFFVFGFLAAKKSRRIVLIISLISIAGIYLYQPARQFIVEKATLSDLSGSIRRQQWKETLEALRDERYFSGFGLSAYQSAIAPYHQEGLFFNSNHLDNFDQLLRNSAEMRAKYWQPVEIYLYPHNIFLNFWSELGLLGALLFTWIIAKYLYISYRLSKQLSRKNDSSAYLALGLAAAMITLAVHGLVDVPYFKNDLAVMFWIMIAMIGLIEKNKQLK